MQTRDKTYLLLTNVLYLQYTLLLLVLLKVYDIYDRFPPKNILFDGSVLVYCVCPTKQSSFINIISIVLVVLKLTKRVLCETRNASVRLLKKHISTEASASTEIGVDLLLDSREKEREGEAF